jgi:hypothetical protein
MTDNYDYLLDYYKQKGGGFSDLLNKSLSQLKKVDNFINDEKNMDKIKELNDMKNDYTKQYNNNKKLLQTTMSSFSDATKIIANKLK